MQHRLHGSIIRLDGRMLQLSLSKVISHLLIIGHFRLNEMLLHVDAHKEGAEITYLVVILHLIDSYILNFQFRHHEHGRVESRLDTDIYFFVLGRSTFLRYSSGRQPCRLWLTNREG